MVSSESPQEQRARHLRELEGKNISHYSALLQAWIETKMERDKAIMILSTAGTGLLATVLSTVGVNSPWIVCLYIGAFVSFIVSILVLLYIFKQNAKLIEKELRAKEGESNSWEVKLRLWDYLAYYSFVVGIVFGISIGLSSALTQPDFKERIIPMTQNKPIGNNKVITPHKRSLEGISSLRPSVSSSTEQLKPNQTQEVAAPTTRPTATSDSNEPSSSSNQ